MNKLLLSITIISFCFLANAQHNWQRTNPGGGGAISTVGATASGMIVAASDLSGIYRSMDDGQSWDAVGANQGLIETHISAFGFDPNDGDTYIAGSYIGAYRTTDGGDNFVKVFPDASHSFDYSYIEDIVIAKSNSNIGYITHHLSAGSYGDVYKTIDGGNSWQEIIGENLPNDLRLVKLMVHPLDENIVYALAGKSRWGCSEANLYRSTNGGINWLEIGASEGDILDVDLHPTNTNIIFISTFISLFVNTTQCQSLSVDQYYDDDVDAGEFYKSTDGGLSFSQIGDRTGIISVGIDTPDIIRLLDVLLPYDWNGSAGTWETKNGGTSWTHTGFTPNWNQGYSINQYYSYSKSFNGLNKTVTKDLFNSDRYYGSFGQWAWGSFNGGITLNNISTEEIAPNRYLSTGVENINGHCLDVNDGNADIVYMGGYDLGFWYSKDHGNSWSRAQPDYNVYPTYSWDIGTPPVDTNASKWGAGSNVMTLLSDPNRENVVWASFSKRQYTDSLENAFANTGLFKSTNYGRDWLLVDNGLPAFNSSFHMYGLSIVASSSQNNRTLFVTVNGNVYRSVTDGNSWQVVLVNGGLKFTEVNKLDGDIVYAGGSNGLWKSSNGGNTWTEVGTVAMRKSSTHLTRPDIVPTWTNWSGPDPIFPWEGVLDIETDPNVANRVYATVMGPDKGLYRSNNAGSSWTKLYTDSTMRGVAVAPENSNVVYVTSSRSYHSGGNGNSKGVQYSTNAGITWQDANDGMAFDYAGTIEIENNVQPYVWAWSPGTGVQRANVPYFLNTNVHIVTSDNDITIYPNPFIDKVIIDGDFDNYEIKIFDSAGVLVTDYTGSTNPITIGLSTLGAGLYFISIQNTIYTPASVYKIIKQ